ncbi:hypothetical protein JCM10207_002046 [Rhodosporidiobolus poonsookiae]
MPIKRSAEEGGRPPLARGSACHRCFARKVRCSGQPDPSTGVHACTSCMRTARFKGHDLALARCAFNGDGICSEEGGPNLAGEVYANAGPGPTPRRKMGSRSHTASSTGSARSHQSTASSAVTDFSFDSPALGSTISPVSSSASLKSLADAASLSSTQPSPENYHLPPPVTYALPPAMPGYGYPAQPPVSLHHHAYPPITTTSLPSTPAPGSPSLATPTQGTCASSILARRAKAAPMSIAMPPPPAQAMGLSPVVSRAPSPAPPQHAASNSAPLAPPSNWGAPPPHPSHNLVPPPQVTAPSAHQPAFTAAPPQTDPLAGAFQSVLTPGTLAKLPTSSYDFSLAPDGAFPPYASGAPPTPSMGHGIGGYSGGPATSTAQAFSNSQTPALPTPLRSLSISELYPPSFTPSAMYGHGTSGIGSTYAASGNGPDFDPAAWSGSFHLPSPGLTFSSTPFRLDTTPGWSQAQSQYFRA